MWLLNAVTRLFSFSLTQKLFQDRLCDIIIFFKDGMYLFIKILMAHDRGGSAIGIASCILSNKRLLALWLNPNFIPNYKLCCGNCSLSFNYIS